MDPSRVARATELWVRDLVVGLNLCPFAAMPLKMGRIRYRVCGETQFENIYRALLAEMGQLVGIPAEETETSLFIVPQGLEAFDDYLELLYAVDAVIPEAGLDGVLQLASFHPDYRFEGVEVDDPANYTNRSPYPMFHLIREASLEQALTGYPDPELIPQRNMEKLRELGLVEIRARLKACY